MGFLFTTPQQQPKGPPKQRTGRAAGGVGPKTAASAATLNRLGCSACPLNDAKVNSPKMPAFLPVRPCDIYFLAEAPGETEDREGEPLIGKSGQLLRSLIPKRYENTCAYDNVVRTRPPKNRDPTWVEVECCRGHHTKSIEKAKPRLVVGLGKFSLNAVLGSMDMQGLRGRMFAVKFGNHSCWFMPTYHPAFILRQAYDDKKPLLSRMGHCFKMDIRRAFDVLDGLKPPRIQTEASIRADILTFDGSEPGHFERLMNLLIVAQQVPEKSVDYETQGLRPYRKDSAVLTCAISYDDPDAGEAHFSFALDHPKAKWTKVQRKAIGAKLLEILSDDTFKVAHNVPFEVEWSIFMYGAAHVRHGAWDCTMMQAHFLDERRGKQWRDDDRRAAYQDLDFLCRQYFGVGYKSFFKLNKKNMAGADLGETLIYNAADTKVALWLHRVQVALLKRRGLYDAYLDSVQRQPATALMQHFGIPVNQKAVVRNGKRLKAEIEEIEDEINDLRVVKDYTRDYGEFNPGSNPDVLKVFKDYLKRSEIKVPKKYHKPGESEFEYSVDEAVLKEIDHPLAELVLAFRNRSKLKSTYCDGLDMRNYDNPQYKKRVVIHRDGLAHSSFNMTFTETGRTSSDDPNLQNFPKHKDAWIRNEIWAPPGYVLVAADYKQLEFCAAACCSGDKVLIDAVWSGYDVHMDWAERLSARYPQAVGGLKFRKDKDVMKALRQKVKNKLVFPAIFGAQDDSIAGYLDMPEDVIGKVMNDFWSIFHGIKTWQDEMMQGYYDEGYVSTMNGRLRWYPLNRNQAINHPVQGSACEIVCDGMTRLSKQAVETEQWHIHPRMNIHDDLSFLIPDDNNRVFEESVETIYKGMLSCPYKWINVPLAVELSAGVHWAEMEAFGNFSSHKDL